MVNSRKKLSFSRVWGFILQFDKDIGIYLFENKNGKEWHISSLAKLASALFTVTVITTMIITNFGVINIIFCISVLVTYISLFIGTLKIIWNKITLKQIFEWCDSLYDIDNKFHRVVQKTAEAHLTEIEAKTVKLLKWMRRIFYADALFASLGFGVISIFCLITSFRSSALQYLFIYRAKTKNHGFVISQPFLRIRSFWYVLQL